MIAATLVIILTLVVSVFILGTFPWSLEFRVSYASLDNELVQDKNIETDRTDNKNVILTFGNAPESQYLYAKPILDSLMVILSFGDYRSEYTAELKPMRKMEKLQYLKVVATIER